MAQTTTSVASKPVWVDLSSSDPEKARAFYADVLGWEIEVNPDPQYGGYALAKVNGEDAAGIGPKMMSEAPTAWQLYIGTDDADTLAKRVEEAGGKVVAPPFDVGDQGRMAVFQDPVGAIISAWQATRMRGFQTETPGAFGWAEINARGIDEAIPFYEKVFGWTHKMSDMPDGQPPYVEFQLGGESILGGMEMNEMMPAEVPSYWTIYFSVRDVDETFRKVTAAGGREMVAPQDFPGGRFAIVSDPEGASFGLLKMAER